MDRRGFLTRSAGLLGASLLAGCHTRGAVAPTIRAITRGPKFHWRGYYDKLLFSPDDRFVLANEVDFEGRSPTLADSIRVGMVDTQDKDRWIDLGGSNAWNWQQGCRFLNKELHWWSEKYRWGIHWHSHKQSPHSQNCFQHIL